MRDILLGIADKARFRTLEISKVDESYLRFTIGLEEVGRITGSVNFADRYTFLKYEDNTSKFDSERVKWKKAEDIPKGIAKYIKKKDKENEERDKDIARILGKA